MNDKVGDKGRATKFQVQQAAGGGGAEGLSEGGGEMRSFSSSMADLVM